MLLSLILLLAAPSSAWDKLTGSSSVADAKNVVVRDAKAWETLWQEHKNDQKAVAPSVDFAGEIVVGIFLGKRPTSGYTIEVSTRPDPLDANRLVVFYKEVAPKKDQPRLTVVSRPFVLIKCGPKAHVSFEEDVPLNALPQDKPRGGLSVDQLNGLQRQLEQLKRFTFPK